jgi:hypothetical protein
MSCEKKDDLYRTLIRIGHLDTARGEGFSHEYVVCVDAIKEHDRTCPNGPPCPDAGH